MANTIDSYSESNQNNFTQLGSASYTEAGNSFTGDGNKLDSAVFFLRKTGSPTGNATAILYAITGTPGTDATPTGAALATSDNFNVSTLTGTFALTTFTFSGANRVTLTNGTHYFVVCAFNNTATPNLVEIGSGNSGMPGTENSARKFGTYIAATTIRWCYYVYSAVPGMFTKNIIARIAVRRASTY